MRLSLRLILFILFLTPAISRAQTAGFTATPLSGCAPLLVQFTSTSTGNITSYSWTFGNGAPPSAFQNPSTTYLTPGTYTVSLTVTGPNGSNTHTVTNYITVYPQPTTDFNTIDTAGCPPYLVHFTNSSVANSPGGITSYAWDFGDGTTDNTASPNHTYQLPGFYNVTLVTTNSAGCSKTLLKPVLIHVFTPPNGNFTVSNFIFCHPPAAVTFTNTTTGTSPYTATWAYGDASTGAGNTPTHSYNSAGSYNVTMTVTDAHGCKDTVYHPFAVTVYNGAVWSAPSSACINSQASFYNNSPTIVSSSWTFGDGGTSLQDTPKHTYTAAGTYTVTLITNLGGCYDTLTQSVVVNSGPSVSFYATPRYPCDTGAPVQFHSTGTGATSYTWAFGDGTTGTGPNPVHGYSQYGLYNVTLYATTGNGCVDSLTKDTIISAAHAHYIEVYAHDQQILASVGAGCAPLTTRFTDTVFAYLPLAQGFVPFTWPSPLVTFYWDFGDGTPTSTQRNPIHTYTLPGSYTVTGTVTTASGCTWTYQKVILVGTHPTANFYASPLTACVKQDINFVSTSTNVGAGTNYNWFFGDGQNSTSVGTNPNITHKYDSAGTFTVKLYVSNNGCIDTISRIAYITINPPSASFIDSVFCPVSLNTVRFTNTSFGYTSQIWRFGDGTTNTAVSPPVHAYPSPGSYNASLITFNSTTGCSDTFYANINLVPPVVSFSTLDSTLCLDDSVQVSANTSFATNFYYWEFDGVHFPNGVYDDTFQTKKHLFTTRGYHSVKLITRDQYGCYDTVYKPNYILISRPIPGFTASPVIGCTPLNVTFTDTSHYTVGTLPQSRNWTFGDGLSGTNNLTTISHSYLNAGLDSIKLIVKDNNGCADSVTRQNYIEARHPIAGFTASDTGACLNTVVTFSNTSIGAGTLTYAWDFGDGTGIAGASPTHTYNTVGNYGVRLIVTDNVGCKDTALLPNYISITKPHASFTLSDTLAICPPLLVHFNNTSTGAASYSWDLGTGSGPSTLMNPVNTYTATGLYAIRMIAYNINGCADTAYAQVRVLGYAGALTYTPLMGCAPMPVNFTAAIVNVPNLIWDFADGTTQPANGATISHTYLTPGAYVPKLIFSDGMGCIASSTGLDTIKVDDVLAGFKVLPPCVNTPVTFTDTSHTFFNPTNSWTWDFGGIPASGAIASHTYSSTGSFPVRLIVTNTIGCRDTVLKNVTIFGLPTITAYGDTTVCPNNPAPLTAAGGISYSWSPAGGLSCISCVAPVATTPVPVTYTVTGTDVNGCSNTDTVHISIQAKTSSFVQPGGEICAGKSFQLYAGGADVYHWTPAAPLDNANIAAPLATPAATTNFMVIATEGTCPPDTNYVKVIVHPNPDLHAGADQTIVSGASVTLTASGTGIGQYLWLFDAATLSCTNCNSPVATPKKTTIYIVTASNQFGCTDTAYTTVHVLCDASQVFIPNTFTPNNDGQNDYFFPRGAGIEQIKTFRVYSRWGEVIYEKTGLQLNDEHSGWDGTFKGAVLPPDVYVYTIDAVCDNGEPLKFKGDITLIR